MMPRSEGQALPSRIVTSGFRRRGEDRGSFYIPGAAGMSEGRQRRPACGPRLLAWSTAHRMDWLGLLIRRVIAMGKWIYQKQIDETVDWFVRTALPDAEPG